MGLAHRCFAPQRAASRAVRGQAQNDGDVVIAAYTYYANDLRAGKEVESRGDFDGTFYFYYDGPEVIEERTGSDTFRRHYVWGPNHIDELALIMGVNGTYFAYQDANWNVIGLATPGGDLAEEYNYTPYGRQLAWRYTTNGDSDADGDVDATDFAAYVAAADTVKGEDEEYDRTFDADYDGDVDDFDTAAFFASYNVGDRVVVANRAWSPNQNPYGFTCRRLDTESLLMHYRLRTYNPGLKCFMQRDPLRSSGTRLLMYADGPDLYRYVRNAPTRYVDPSGLKVAGVGGSVEILIPPGAGFTIAASVDGGVKLDTLTLTYGANVTVEMNIGLGGSLGAGFMGHVSSAERTEDREGLGATLGVDLGAVGKLSGGVNVGLEPNWTEWPLVDVTHKGASGTVGLGGGIAIKIGISYTFGLNGSYTMGWEWLQDMWPTLPVIPPIPTMEEIKTNPWYIWLIDEIKEAIGPIFGGSGSPDPWCPEGGIGP